MRNTDGFPYLVIDSDNAHRFAAGGPENGGSFGYQGWQEPGLPHRFGAARPFGETIPRNQWHGLIKEGQGSFLSDLVKANNILAKDQNGLSACWGYGATRAVEIRRVESGLPHKELAPESVTGPCTGWRDRGGYASEAFAQLARGGACEMSFLNAPHSLDPTRWKPGWQENARLHEAVQWYEIGTSYDEIITCLLNRIPVAAGIDRWDGGRQGHLICMLDPIILPDGSVGVLFQNSWGRDWPYKGANGLAVLTERKGTPDGAAAPVLVLQSAA